MKIKEAFLEKYRSDRVLLGEWIMLGATVLFMFVAISFVDMHSLTIWSTNVLDVTFDGNIRNLYEFTAKNLHNVQHQYLGSELFSVLPLSIWNIPIWIAQRFFGKDIMHSAVLMAWSKLFGILLTGIMLKYTHKITMLITNDRIKAMWAVFLTASSTFIYLGVYYAGQNDIIMMVPSVIGIYCLLKGSQKGFIIWSAVAIAIKPFFLFAFLAVLLLYEKNIIKAILKAAVSVSGLALQKLIFLGAPMYKESIELGPSKHMLEQMFPTNLDTCFGGISFFAIALVLILLYAYTRDFTLDDVRAGEVHIAKYVIYFVTLTNTAYLMFSPFTYYRLATLAPFLYIMMVQHKRMYFYNGILETSMAAGLLLKMGFRQNTSLFRAKSLNLSLIQRFFGYSVPIGGEEKAYTSISTWLRDNDSLLIYYTPLFSGVAVVCAALLLILNHPEEKIKTPINGDKNCRVLLWGRILMIIPFIIFTIWLFMKAPIKNY